MDSWIACEHAILRHRMLWHRVLVKVVAPRTGCFSLDLRFLSQPKQYLPYNDFSAYRRWLTVSDRIFKLSLESILENRNEKDGKMVRFWNGNVNGLAFFTAWKSCAYRTCNHITLAIGKEMVCRTWSFKLCFDKTTKLTTPPCPSPPTFEFIASESNNKTLQV